MAAWLAGSRYAVTTTCAVMMVAGGVGAMHRDASFTEEWYLLHHDQPIDAATPVRALCSIMHVHALPAVSRAAAAAAVFE